MSGKTTGIRGLAAPHRACRHRAERGYILLSLLLLVALVTITAGVLASDLAFEIKRDREEELIHRGVQYSRAIKLYAKKTGRFPLTLEQLLGTGDIRYIRKLYKDPVTGKDFRLLHMGDIYSASGTSNLSASAPQNGDANTAAASDSNSATATASNAASTTAQTSGLPASGSQTSGLTANPQASSPARGPAQGSNPESTFGQVIFGVASSSKKATIREFYHKNHYNDWLFFYDPNYDRGAEIKGPTSTTPVVNQSGASPSQPPAQNSQPQPTQNSAQPQSQQPQGSPQ